MFSHLHGRIAILGSWLDQLKKQGTGRYEDDFQSIRTSFNATWFFIHESVWFVGKAERYAGGCIDTLGRV